MVHKIEKEIICLKGLFQLGGVNLQGVYWLFPPYSGSSQVCEQKSLIDQIASLWYFLQ